MPSLMVKRPAPFKPGQRVATHPATDAFMRGERFGDVVRCIRGKRVRVKMDSGRIAVFHENNLAAVS